MIGDEITGIVWYDMTSFDNFNAYAYIIHIDKKYKIKFISVWIQLKLELYVTASIKQAVNVNLLTFFLLCNIASFLRHDMIQ